MDHSDVVEVHQRPGLWRETVDGIGPPQHPQPAAGGIGDPQLLEARQVVEQGVLDPVVGEQLVPEATVDGGAAEAGPQLGEDVVTTVDEDPLLRVEAPDGVAAEGMGVEHLPGWPGPGEELGRGHRQAATVDAEAVGEARVGDQQAGAEKHQDSDRQGRPQQARDPLTPGGQLRGLSWHDGRGQEDRRQQTEESQVAHILQRDQSHERQIEDGRPVWAPQVQAENRRRQDQHQVVEPMRRPLRRQPLEVAEGTRLVQRGDVERDAIDAMEKRIDQAGRQRQEPQGEQGRRPRAAVASPGQRAETAPNELEQAPGEA